MKRKALLFGLIMFLISGLAGLNLIKDNHLGPQKKQSVIPERGSRGLTGVFNEKEGWGFVRSRDGRTPEITARQKKLIAQYNALFMGNTEKKQVTFTFDMGYEKENLTLKILEILKKEKIKASFFVTTHWIETNQDTVKQLVADGHLLMNHTVRHKSLPTLSDQEIREEILGWEDAADKTAGYKIRYKYMRPPMGEYSERTLKITMNMGYRTAFWSIAIKDWVPMAGPEEAVTGIVKQLHNGAVILMHGNSEDVVGGLAQIIAQTREKGYKIVPIYEI